MHPNECTVDGRIYKILSPYPSHMTPEEVVSAHWERKTRELFAEKLWIASSQEVREKLEKETRAEIEKLKAKPNYHII